MHRLTEVLVPVKSCNSYTQTGKNPNTELFFPLGNVASVISHLTVLSYLLGFQFLKLDQRLILCRFDKSMSRKESQRRKAKKITPPEQF